MQPPVTLFVNGLALELKVKLYLKAFSILKEYKKM